MQYTDDQLVQRYIELRDYVEAENKAFTARMADYTNSMRTIENFLLGVLTERGAENSKTEHGTFFKVTHMSTKVADKDALFEHVRTTDNFSLLAGNVSKDSVQEYMDVSGGHPPPGLEVTYFTKVNVRRS